VGLANVLKNRVGFSLMKSLTTILSTLNGWALYSAIGTINAAIALFGFYKSFALFTFIEVLA